MLVVFLVLQLLYTQILALGRSAQHVFLQGSFGVWTRDMGVFANLCSCCSFLFCLYKFHFLRTSHTLCVLNLGSSRHFSSKTK